MAPQSFRQSDGSFKPVLGSLPPTTTFADSGDPEADRRRRLAASDELLDEIEDLNLLDRRDLPAQVRNRITALHFAVTGGRPQPTPPPSPPPPNLVLAFHDPPIAAN